MDGPNFTIGVIYGLIVFTLFLTLKSNDAWQQILPFMTLLALAYTALLIAVTLLMLVVLKIAFDIIDLINRLNNPPEGMFFYIKIVCMYINKTKDWALVHEPELLVF